MNAQKTLPETIKLMVAAVVMDNDTLVQTYLVDYDTPLKEAILATQMLVGAATEEESCTNMFIGEHTFDTLFYKDFAIYREAGLWFFDHQYKNEGFREPSILEGLKIVDTYVRDHRGLK